MIRVARSALLALLACVACLGPLAAQAPAVIDAAPVTAARIDDCGRLRRERPEAGHAREERKQRAAGDADHRPLQDGDFEA